VGVRALAPAGQTLRYYHMQIMEGDVIRTLQAHHPLIGLYHGG
jgi:hydroxypyruvate isomerase